MGKVADRVEAVLLEFKDGLRAIYGDRLTGLVLYGSYARGEAREDSDIDTAVILRGPIFPGDEIERTSLLRQRICLEHGVLVSSVYVTEGDLGQGKDPLLMNIRRDGQRV